jgi:hypothetical protein
VDLVLEAVADDKEVEDVDLQYGLLNFFSSSLTVGQNKLERFSLAS